MQAWRFRTPECKNGDKANRLNSLLKANMVCPTKGAAANQSKRFQFAQKIANFRLRCRNYLPVLAFA